MSGSRPRWTKNPTWLLAALVATTPMAGRPCAAGGEAPRRPETEAIERVDFERHVMGLLGRLGCSSGACHGSFQGRGGLRLSLFGHDPAHDVQVLTHDGSGRRINVVEPERSLFLLKPTAAIPHEGGRRFAKESWEYRVLRDWIAQGAGWRPEHGAVARIEVQPREHRFSGPGETVPLRVLVTFRDGSTADMTPYCDIRARDDSIAEVSPTGRVRGLRPGVTAIIVSYRGHPAAAQVLVPNPLGNATACEADADFGPPEANFIDREVFARLRRLRAIPSAISSDAEFLRRVTIDTIGSLPSPEAVRSFLADTDPAKRAQAIDRLLAHPLHAALWATRFCDITGCSLEAMEGPEELRPKRAKMWHDWFRRRIAQNVPYDQIVRGVLCATSRDGVSIGQWLAAEAERLQAARAGFRADYASRPSLDLFWRRFSRGEFLPLEPIAELVAAAFLGVRIECAQCHKHPFDRWTQADYRSFANVFGKVEFGSSPEVLAATARLLEDRRRASPDHRLPPVPRLREVYLSESPNRRLRDPATNQPLEPRVLGGPAISQDGDPRAALLAWLVRPDNPYFAASFVNRVWAAYFHIGLVEPVDNFSVANPPSNQRLLDAMAREFVASGYDLRHLERLILSSATYQLSSTPDATNAQDQASYSHAIPRRMMAEVVVDVLSAALGAPVEYGPDVPQGVRAIEIAPNRVEDPRLARVFRIFGRPERTTSCDCQRVQAPSIPQTLFLMTDKALLERIGRGRLKALLQSGRSDHVVIEELFLATLTRFPSGPEMESAREYVQRRKDREEALAGVVWALINTREFIMNH
jgi:hypothetical protein